MKEKSLILATAFIFALAMSNIVSAEDIEIDELVIQNSDDQNLDDLLAEEQGESWKTDELAEEPNGEAE